MLSIAHQGGQEDKASKSPSIHVVFMDSAADIRYVQEFLGHADLSTTQVYVHVSMTKLREVYKRTHPAAQE